MEHVKGHQDEKRQWYELTQMESLNVRADSHATSGADGIDGHWEHRQTGLKDSKTVLH
jgi:hypothetical protein